MKNKAQLKFLDIEGVRSLLDYRERRGLLTGFVIGFVCGIVTVAIGMLIR